jgi:hypothetical protein
LTPWMAHPRKEILFSLVPYFKTFLIKVCNKVSCNTQEPKMVDYKGTHVIPQLIN